MLRYYKLERKPALFLSFTGLTVAGFRHLLPAFAAAYMASLDEQDKQRQSVRQRVRGGGRIATLATMEDKLLFILFYFKLYPIQSVQGYFFDLSQPQANEWIQRLTPVLHVALGEKKQLPMRKPSDAAAVMAACPELQFIIDGTERLISRPKNSQRQTEFYSGKKKRHTVKNTVITDRTTKKILVLGKTVAGKQHDKRLADEENWSFPPGSDLWKDTGYQGYEPDNTLSHQPTKKPKGGELTDEQKQQNQQFSQERIGVEHSIGGVKFFRIAHDTFRNRIDGLIDSVMAVACGLHNLRLVFPLTA